jgi:quercetin dioxygenase-like cupin family protein
MDRLLLTFALAGILAIPAFGQTAAGQDSDMRLVAASGLKWVPARGLPTGAQSALLAGNPGKEGAFVLRLKMPANYRIPPHHHPTEEAVTVLSGEVSVGTGDKLDKADAKALKAGDFVLLPAGVNHYAFARTESVIEVHSTGPFSATYADPADDPMKGR